ATGVTGTDPVPGHTTLKSVGDGGSASGGTVTWNGVTIPAGGAVDLHFTVTIDPNLDPAVTQIVNDGLHAPSAQGPSTSGSPHVNTISPQFAVSATPPSMVRSAQVGNVASYSFTVTNQGYGTEAFDLTANGNAWATV